MPGLGAFARGATRAGSAGLLERLDSLQNFFDVARDRESLWFPDHGHLPTNRETPAGGCAIGRDPASVMHGIVAIGP